MADQNDRRKDGKGDAFSRLQPIFAKEDSKSSNWRLESWKLERKYADMLVSDFPDLAKAYAKAVASEEEAIYETETRRIAQEFLDRAPIDRSLYPSADFVLGALRRNEDAILRGVQ